MFHFRGLGQGIDCYRSNELLGFQLLASEHRQLPPKPKRQHRSSCRRWRIDWKFFLTKLLCVKYWKSFIVYLKCSYRCRWHSKKLFMRAFDISFINVSFHFVIIFSIPDFEIEVSSLSVKKKFNSSLIASDLHNGLETFCICRAACMCELSRRFTRFHHHFDRRQFRQNY